MALAKQSKPESMRIIKMPGALAAMGYWLISQKVSVLGILPSTSTPGRIECSNIFAKEMATCKIKHQKKKISGLSIYVTGDVTSKKNNR